MTSTILTKKIMVFMKSKLILFKKISLLWITNSIFQKILRINSNWSISKSFTSKILNPKTLKFDKKSYIYYFSAVYIVIMPKVGFVDDIIIFISNIATKLFLINCAIAGNLAKVIRIFYDND